MLHRLAIGYGLSPEPSRHCGFIGQDTSAGKGAGHTSSGKGTWSGHTSNSPNHSPLFCYLRQTH